MLYKELKMCMEQTPGPVGPPSHYFKTWMVVRLTQWWSQWGGLKQTGDRNDSRLAVHAVGEAAVVTRVPVRISSISNVPNHIWPQFSLSYQKRQYFDIFDLYISKHYQLKNKLVKTLGQFGCSDLSVENHWKPILFPRLLVRSYT